MRWMIAALLLVSSATLAGQSGAKNGEWTTYGADLGNTRYSAARSDQRRQLQQAGDRLALQDREPRTAARVPVRVDAADGQGRRVFDRRHAPRGRRARRGHGRADVDAQRARRRARRGGARASSRAAASSYWTDGREERILYVTPGYRLVALDAKTGMPVSELRHARRRRSQAGQRSGDRSRHRRGRPPLRAGRRRQHDHHRRRAPVGRRAARQEQRQGLHPRIRRQERQADVDLPHDSAPGRVRQRHLARRFVVVHRQHRRRGRRCRSTKSWGWRTCRSKRRPATTSAGIGTATTCSAKASSRSI